MTARIKIRGIYSTALTKLAMDAGYAIVDPSPKTLERFDIDCDSAPHNISIRDKADHQGITLCGSSEHVSELLTFLQEKLFDVVLIECGAAESHDGWIE